MTFSYSSGAQGFPVRYNVHDAGDRIWRLLGVITIMVTVVATILLSVAKQINNRIAFQPQAPIHVPAVAAASTDENQQSTRYEEVVTAPAIDEELLQTEIDNWVAQQPKAQQWAISLHSLDNNQVDVGVAETQQFELASIYKLFLLKPLVQKMTVLEWEKANLTDKTYAECVHVMLARSDNPCAEAIVEKLGWNAIHASAQADGFNSTLFNRNDYIVGTVADTSRLLQKIYTGEGFTSAARALVLNGMEVPKYAEGVRRGCVDCQDVYNKTGQINNVVHDASVIRKNNRNYTLVIFSENGTWQQITEITQILTSKL